VRRALQEKGFSITKLSGFGKKREMVTALYSKKIIIEEHPNPWFNTPVNIIAIKNVAIIGAGLAGCTTAEALARRGIKVTIFDSSDTICSLASGNLQGALYAKLSSKPTTSGELHLTGLEYSLRLLSLYHCFDKQTAEQCGVLQLATSHKEEIQQQDLVANDLYSSEVLKWVDAKTASKLIGHDTPFSGLFFPRAGWVMPKLFCDKLINHQNIKLELSTSVTNLTQLENNYWTLTSNQGDRVFDAVVIANAHSAKQFSQCSQASIKAIRGQVTHCKKATTNNLKTVVCGAGYISPPINGKYCFGASFNLHNAALTLTYSDQKNNIQNLQKILPSFSDELTFPDHLTGKAAHRCSSPDYMPQVGPVPIYDKFISQYQKLNKDKNWRFENTAAPNYNGLFINIGHGSKGLITCPLSAEHLASMMLNHPSPLPKNLSNAIHPARFVIKQLIKRVI
jgi:tRNA 5-methylaminomethyl-2-thiouridine biosynthesis bifunctional protein